MSLAETTLTTARLVLRRPHPRDAAATTAFYMSERAQYVGGHVPRAAAARQFYAVLGHWEVHGCGLWAVTEQGNDAIHGLVGPYCPDGWPEPEIGWLMFDGAEGKGLAFEAASAAIDDARTRLGWSEIVHYIAPANTRSITLAQRLGATLDADATPPNPDKPALVFRQPRPPEAPA